MSPRDGNVAGSDPRSAVPDMPGLFTHKPAEPDPAGRTGKSPALNEAGPTGESLNS
jgi:hypothetical protein